MKHGVQDKSKLDTALEQAICNASVQADDLKTAPMDWRFPATNQAKHCYYSYNEFHKYTPPLLQRFIP